MLVINKQDIQTLLNMKDAINIMENALKIYKENRFSQPNRTFSKIYSENNFLLMPCFTENCIGLKINTVYPNNNNLDEPKAVTQGMVMINDINNGEFLSLMDGTILTAIKTGAISGVAIKHIKPNAKTVGIIGTGLQGLYQLIAAVNSASIKKVYLYTRTPSKINKFIKDFEKIYGTNIGIDFEKITDVITLVQKSDIVITATTSLKPVIPEHLHYNNQLFIAVGSYKENMRELPLDLYQLTDQIYIDALSGIQETGDLIDPIKKGTITENQIEPLYNILNNWYNVNKSNKPIIFKNINMALFDTVLGNYVYQNAKANQKGTEIDI